VVGQGSRAVMGVDDPLPIKPIAFYLSSSVGTFDVVVPSNAYCFRAQAIGMGGQGQVSGGLNLCGGGGAFAAVIRPCSPGETLVVSVPPVNTSPPASGSPTMVTQGGVVVLSADCGMYGGQAGGPENGYRVYGGRAENCIGDIARSGGEGGCYGEINRPGSSGPGGPLNQNERGGPAGNFDLHPPPVRQLNTSLASDQNSSSSAYELGGFCYGLGGQGTLYAARPGRCLIEYFAVLPEPQR
ncbi:MAG: hypothetical protein ACK4IW_09900, partial [Brevundimonas aurantiaca]